MELQESSPPVVDCDILENDGADASRRKSNATLELSDVMHQLEEQKVMLTKILDRLDEGFGHDSRDPPSGHLGRLPGTRSPSFKMKMSTESFSSQQTSNEVVKKRSTAASKLSANLRTTLGDTSPEPWLRRIVHYPAFDLFFGFLIFLNSMTLIVEEQYTGVIVGYEFEYYSQYGSPEWRAAYFDRDSFYIVEAVFACAFTIEVLLRIFGEGWTYFKKPTEYFDILVVVLSDISVLSDGGVSFGVRVQVLRLLRAAKLMRLVRLIRTVEGFDALSLMMTALGASAWALCWSVILLTLLVTLCACLVTTFFREVYFTSDSPLSRDSKNKLFEYFGTFVRSLLSLFELALANWPPICRFLVEDLHESYMVFVVMYKLVMGFAVIGVINAVFMQETFKVANTDDNIMVRTKTRAANMHKNKMKELFLLADKDGGGKISEDEFREVLRDPTISLWLSSMELEAKDVGTLFKMISGEDGQIELDELIDGISRFKGAARSIDLHTLMMKVDDAQKQRERDRVNY